MGHRVCPWWLGYFLASPVRRFAHNPERILGSRVKPGTAVLDFGCGMGCFSLPMARMVGAAGRVVCVDIQPRMLAELARRGARAGLDARLEPRLATAQDSGFSGLAAQIDFALVFAVVHEVPDAARLFADLAGVVKPGGGLLLAEPILHVRKAAFLASVALAESVGFAIVDRPRIRRCRAVLLERSA
jgi:2-polyprenyl-3-methyl-5-hydroxy-6-metoxy-1,4-benzoquinol methylase